jgi:hypothetical protein
MEPSSQRPSLTLDGADSLLKSCPDQENSCPADCAATWAGLSRDFTMEPSPDWTTELAASYDAIRARCALNCTAWFDELRDTTTDAGSGGASGFDALFSCAALAFGRSHKCPLKCWLSVGRGRPCFEAAQVIAKVLPALSSKVRVLDAILPPCSGPEPLPLPSTARPLDAQCLPRCGPRAAFAGTDRFWTGVLMSQDGSETGCDVRRMPDIVERLLALCLDKACPDECLAMYEHFYVGGCIRAFQPFFVADGMRNGTIRAIVDGCEARRTVQAPPLRYLCCTIYTPRI